uniref:ARAD1D21010p n=1 Tax=Blastobotrys adeninivorans TaxID=409370 RepID=A0A060T9S1_BLAAD
MFVLGGVIAQANFVSGNVALTATVFPSLRKSNIPPSQQLRVWNGIYDRAAVLFGASSLVSGLCYGAAAYLRPSIRTPMVISALFALSPLPVTALFILPVVKELKRLDTQSEKDEAAISTNLDRWMTLSIVRFVISTIGLANVGYFFLSRCCKKH